MMACPGCVIGPAIGSSLGSLYSLPEKLIWKVVSVISTVALTILTTLTIKTCFGVSFCGETFTWLRAVTIITGSTLVGVVYSIGINYLLNRILSYFSAPVTKNVQKIPPTPVSACCQSNKNH